MMKTDHRIYSFSSLRKKRRISFVLLLCFLLFIHVLSERKDAFIGNSCRFSLGVRRSICEPCCFAADNFRSQSLAAKHETLGLEKNDEAALQRCFPDFLIKSLDLAPLIRSVATHAATRRGYRAILSLVNDDIEEAKNSRILDASKQRHTSRQKRAAGLAGRDVSFQTKMRSLNHKLVSIAASSEDARQEYELVEQATLALSENPYNLTYPPLYGQHSNPMDIDTTPVTDDDEWLYLAPDDWTLEYIIQAEQVIDTLLNVKAWAAFDETEAWMPALSTIGLEIDPEDSLGAVRNEILDVIEIVQVRTAVPTDKGAYTFRLNDEKFPILALLRGKYGIIMKRGGKELDKDVVEIQTEIEMVESQIRIGLAQTILNVCAITDEGLDILSRLDIVFTKAAFGMRTNGKVPWVSNHGEISVRGFVHPLIGSENRLLPQREPVPTSLFLSQDDGERVLVISGPNGGGKTLVLKSFGIAVTFAKLGIPIPMEAQSNNKPRVDYFKTVLVNVGDQQSLVEGESTWTGMLNSCASIIDAVSGSCADESFLVLLDELGSGTDPEAGGAISQALLEEMISHPSCYVVATTHSPRLKALSYESPQICCATVLLKGGTSPNGYKVPSFQLQYGVIGESYAMGAASRCTPALPPAVLSRASQLMAKSLSETERKGADSGYFRVLTESLEKQVQQAIDERLVMEQNSRDSVKCRSAMISLASSYEQHLSRLESRLDSLFQQLKKEDKESVDLVGETISELRVVQRQILGQKELLKERGLKLLPTSYDLQVGESVVVIAEGEMDGSTVKIVADGMLDSTLGPNEVLVQHSNSFFGSDEPPDATNDGDKNFVVPRHELALWDYASAWDEEDGRVSAVTSTSDSKRRLTSLLSNLKSSRSVTKTKERSTKDAAGNNSSFASARERKAAKTKAKRKGKRKK